MKIRLMLSMLAVFLLLPLPALAVDADGDGHRSVSSGGDDCDDRDPNRFPGNTEVCDDRHHDEDCNPETFGRRDVDRDGLNDNRCCNISTNGVQTCGRDCDDSNRAIQTDSQVCDGEHAAICSADGQYVRSDCPAGTICVVQPNRTGVCMIRPQGYVAPPSLNLSAPTTISPAAVRRYPAPARRTMQAPGRPASPPSADRVRQPPPPLPAVETYRRVPAPPPPQ